MKPEQTFNKKAPGRRADSFHFLMQATGGKKQRWTMTACLIFILIFLAGIFDTGLCLQKKTGKSRAPLKKGQKIIPSGLVPLFIKGSNCVGIASAYGATTRYDGSMRPKFRYNGRHGGIDLSLHQGTPLLAIAAGTLIHKAEGEQMEGIYLWLLHTPGDTGKPFYVFTKYQHLKAMPRLNVGDKVAAGQFIAMSGSTGTHGGHYGLKGYPHLHFSTMKSASADYMIKDNKLFTKALLFDPLELFQTRADQKKVPIAYKNCSGEILPKGSKVIWPVNCVPEPKSGIEDLFRQ